MTSSQNQATKTQAPFIIKLLRVTVITLMFSLAFSLYGCSPDDEEWTPATREVGPYYEERFFSQVDGRYRYKDANVTVEKTGVDVSDHQGVIDWDSVAADGIDFAFIRIGYRGTTEGGLFVDERFSSNLLGAQGAGIECGVYFFSQATTVEEAEEEAALVLGLLDGCQLEYPVAFDYESSAESRISGVSSQTATDAARAFCSAIQQGGYEAMIYGNAYDLARFDYHWIADYPLWFAEYGDSPSYERRAIIWQYTGEGVVNGINAYVDLNLDLSEVPSSQR